MLYTVGSLFLNFLLGDFVNWDFKHRQGEKKPGQDLDSKVTIQLAAVQTSPNLFVAPVTLSRMPYGASY